MNITNKKGLLTATALKSGYTELVVKKYTRYCRQAQMDVLYSFNGTSFQATGHVLTTYGDGRIEGYDVNAIDTSIRSLREGVNKNFYSGAGVSVGHEINAPVQEHFNDIANGRD